MSSKKNKHLLLKTPFAIVVVALTILTGYQLIHQWPLSERDKAHRNSVQLWGTKPLVGHLASQGEVQPSSGGPYRNFVFQFTDKFGQTEKVNGDFLLKSPPPKLVKIWQKQSTGDVMLPETYDPPTGYIGPNLPYYDGGKTQFWFTFVGVLGTLIALIILGVIAALIYEAVDGRVEEIRKDRQLKRQKSAAAPSS